MKSSLEIQNLMTAKTQHFGLSAVHGRVAAETVNPDRRGAWATACPVIAAATVAVLVLMCSPRDLAAQPFGRFFDPNGDQNDSSTAPVSPAVAAVRAADLAYQTGDYKTAKSQADAAIAINPELAVAWHLRGSAKIEMGKAARDNKLVRDGISDARQALSIAGVKTPILYVPYAFGLTTLGELEKRPEHAKLVLQVLQPVLARTDVSDSDRAYILYQRGLANASLADHKSAIEDYNAAIQRQPMLLAARLKLAGSYMAIGDTANALATFDAAIAQSPDNVMVLNERGFARRAGGDLKGAISDFGKCLELNKSFVLAAMNRGVCYAESNQPELALADFTKVIANDPKLAVAYRLRGNASMAIGEYTSAMNDYSKVIELVPEDLAAWEERGFTRYIVGDFPAAIADFEHARSIPASTGRTLVWQYLAAIRSGNKDLAKSLAEGPLAEMSTGNDWLARVAGMLLDKITAEQLLSVAERADKSVRGAWVCEAHWFIGQKMFDADQPAALEHFRLAEETKQYVLAAYRGAASAKAGNK